MSVIQSVPLGYIADWFDDARLDMPELLGQLIQRWASTDVAIHYELTCNFINNEMGLDEDYAEDFLNFTVNELVQAGAEVRRLALTGKLLAYTVTSYVILLTLAE